ncbi:prephenate dehydratase [Parasphingorhabdus pacifica]
MPHIAYLGPEGTFTEQATRDLTADFGADLVPHTTVSAALNAVRTEHAEAAVVPMENSVEGSVPATMDGLIAGEPLVAVREAVLPIRFDILVRRGTTAAEVSTLASHPHALAQVRDWVDENLPGVETVAASSTAAAATQVSAGAVDAAVSAPMVAENHDSLERLAGDIADVPDAATRFLLVRPPAELSEPSGSDRTSIAVVISHEVGALTEMLTELSLRGINLSRIESRPIKNRIGEYRFYLDFDGHVADARIGDALSGLRRRCGEVRFLGSYPKADRSPTRVRAFASEQTFRESYDWLAEVRAGKRA